MRLTADMRVAAIRRFAEQDGGFAMVLRRGDGSSGDILLQIVERGGEAELFSRQIGADGNYRWSPVLLKDKQNQAVEEYIGRARNRDPDLWVVEVDVADKARFVLMLGQID